MENQIEQKEVSVIETALAKENVTNQVIEKLKTDYMGLTIKGLDDKAGFKAVEEARKECKSLRVITTKICKVGREDAIKTQKDWIAKEKEVVAEIEIVESYLEDQSDAIKELEKQILFEAAQKAKLPLRKEKLASIGIELKDEDLLKLDDEKFGMLFNEFYEKHLEAKAELLRIENEKIALAKAEEERLKLEAEKEAERIKNEAIKKENEKLKLEAEEKEKALEAERKKQAEILAEQKRKSDEEKLEVERLAKIESDKQAKIIAEQKAEQEKILAEQRKETEKLQAELKAKADAEEAILKEVELAKQALLNAGDKEKLIAFGVAFSALEIPELKTKKSTETFNTMRADFILHLKTLIGSLK